jgi:hypothetical protein
MMRQTTARRSLTGPFSAKALGGGAWHLAAASSDGPEVFLRGAGADAPDLLGPSRIARIALEWRGDAVSVSVSGAQGTRLLTVSSAIIHEPRPTLYETLPLSGFDAGARRFWRRIFRLMRVPGGRFLLGVVSRVRRGRRGTASQ